MNNRFLMLARSVNEVPHWYIQIIHSHPIRITSGVDDEGRLSETVPRRDISVRA